MTIKLSDLELAFDFVSFGGEYEHSAYLDKDSGNIFYDSDASEDVLPEDLFTNDKYIEIPHKKEFGLGKPLAIEFTVLIWRVNFKRFSRYLVQGVLILSLNRFWSLMTY